MRLKPKPKIRPGGGATRERSSIQQSVCEVEKACNSTTATTTSDSVVSSKSCDNQEASSQTSNCESIKSTKTCLTSADRVSSGSSDSDITCQTCNASSINAATITNSTVSISSASITSLSNHITTISSSSTSVTTTSTNVNSSTRPSCLTSLSGTRSLTAANAENTANTPASSSSSDVITELFNDEELPNIVQAENVLICDNDSDVEYREEDEEATTEHHYPSFVESLSHIMSGHKALGLEQPAEGEVQSSAVEGTLRQRCDESNDEIGDDDLNGDGGNNVIEDISVEGTAEKQVHVHVCSALKPCSEE